MFLSVVHPSSRIPLEYETTKRKRSSSQECIHPQTRIASKLALCIVWEYLFEIFVCCLEYRSQEEEEEAAKVMRRRFRFRNFFFLSRFEMTLTSFADVTEKNVHHLNKYN